MRVLNLDMVMNVNELLGQEWITLQNNFEQYERSALLIKGASLLVSLAGFLLALDASLMAAVVLVCWLQEGIFRTFQSRLGQHILKVESLIAQGASSSAIASSSPALPFQLHSEWLATRPPGLALLQAYATSACRPTVAYPHALFFIGFVISGLW
jgi:hypothetical protein